VKSSETATLIQTSPISNSTFKSSKTTLLIEASSGLTTKSIITTTSIENESYPTKKPHEPDFDSNEEEEEDSYSGSEKYKNFRKIILKSIKYNFLFLGWSL
jgi:hypothetical protein